MSLSVSGLNIAFLHDTNGWIYDKNKIGRGYAFEHSMCCIKKVCISDISHH